MPSKAALRSAAYDNDFDADQDENDPFFGASVELLLGTASDIVAKIASTSDFFDDERDKMFPRFDNNEVVLGRVLGRGGFCCVYEVKQFYLLDASPAAKYKQPDNVDEMYTRPFLAKRCIRDGEARYALKKLSDECRAKPERFLKGAIDLAVEARFLAVLEHPHIIKMRAVANVSPFDESYFILLDRLGDTLETRFNKWKKRDRKTKGTIGFLTRGKKKKNQLDLERLNVAFDLSTALRHMHSLNIIYRDLKPENIGFDVRNDPKIFDLGLAKELKLADCRADGTYNITGFTGSLRYMAPEVALSMPYNLSADVFSFGMLFWQIMSLVPPFATYSCKMHDELVVKKGYRPGCNKSWPSGWTNIIKRCWTPDWKDRPTFTEISDILCEEATRYEHSEEIAIDLDVSHRSAKSG